MDDTVTPISKDLPHSHKMRLYLNLSSYKNKILFIKENHLYIDNGHRYKVESILSFQCYYDDEKHAWVRNKKIV